MLSGVLTPKRLVALVALLVVTAAVIVASYEFDHSSDRRRPMYRRVVLMQQLQYDQLREKKPPVLGEFRPGRPPVPIGEGEYKNKAHVHLWVAERDGKTCVRAKNQYGDHTSWLCVDPTTTRPTLGGLL